MTKKCASHVFSIPRPQKCGSWVRCPSHLSSARTSGRRAHPDCVPGLLPASHFEEPSDDSRAGANACGGIGKARDDPDGRGVDSHARWTLAGAAAPHPAGERRSGDFGPHPDHSPLPTTATNQSLAGGFIDLARGRPSALPVVKTFELALLNLNGLAEGMPLKCESRVSDRNPALAGGARDIRPCEKLRN